MINHYVLFKLKKDLPRKRLEELEANMKNLSKEIAGIDSMAFGESINHEQKDQEFKYCISMIFTDLELLDNYVSHEKHKEVVEKYIAPIIEDVLVFDYEI